MDNQNLTSVYDGKKSPFAERAGKYARKHGKDIIVVLLLGALVGFIVYLFIVLVDSEVREADASTVSAASLYAMRLRHRGCKHSGGCCRKCPYISNDDPRVAMGSQITAMNNLYASITATLQKDQVASQSIINEMDAEQDSAIIEQLQKYFDLKKSYVNEMYGLVTKANQIDASFGNTASIDVSVMNAKNQITGIEAAVNTLRNKFVATVVKSSTLIMVRKISQVDATQVDGYDQMTSQSTTKATNVNSIYDDILKQTAASTDFDKALQLIKGDPTTEQITSSMGPLMVMSTTTFQQIMAMVASFEVVNDVYEKTVNAPVGFTNSVPGSMNADEVSSLIQNGDYNTALIKTALEPEIVTNHKKFAMERATFDSGGGVPSVRDDDNDVVSWVGLFGRPTYKKSNGSSIEISSEPLKAIPSDNPNDLMRTKNPRLSFV